MSKTVNPHSHNPKILPPPPPPSSQKPKIPQNPNIFSFSKPIFSKAGRQARSIIMGGPHMTIKTSSAAGKNFSWKRSRETKPVGPVQLGSLAPFARM